MIMEIIPAIDIIDGKCVRLTNGDYSKKVIYNEDPLEVALAFENTGLSRLHLVDLDGAKKGSVVNYNVLEKIASGTTLKIDFSGGIKSDEAIQLVFDSGATFASIGSIAVQNKNLFVSWVKKYGSDKIILGADVNNEKIAISGWLEKTDISVVDFMEENYKEGVRTVFCTDISKDGLMQGPGLELYKKIREKFPDLNLIASGGISGIKDLVALKEVGCSGAIVGKAIYEGKIKLNELRNF